MYISRLRYREVVRRWGGQGVIKCKHNLKFFLHFCSRVCKSPYHRHLFFFIFLLSSCHAKYIWCFLRIMQTSYHAKYICTYRVKFYVFLTWVILSSLFSLSLFSRSCVTSVIIRRGSVSFVSTCPRRLRVLSQRWTDVYSCRSLCTLRLRSARKTAEHISMCSTCNATQARACRYDIQLDYIFPSLPKTVAASMQLNANGSNWDKVIITYLNRLLCLT